ncbi:uncharacterized protein LOC125239056 [Leguminivora glycinivorella]|uniref:uncharacterized protein LOC125225140 n=1 Tax=Leguminivora glycinivorella TaxID=1035111 RepID=UPI002010155D|nr:uncharacterized protein LOC125225140 [Leguminivora glycinivorella]XP_047992270.1 uncharacterized protein LOC125230992 [Leguminivora glycinivorella]XP_048001106.1 uncharacterized protein LOC125237914 [Leguminivora glycinivorella]XP_048002470.1 uncharacterized protein LOC125239056 [Leguminivora glycinivorella]
MKPKSPVYSYFTENTINNKKSYTCNFCSVVYNYRNATKFAVHIIKCKKSPQDVKDSFKKNDKNSSTLCEAQVLSDSDHSRAYTSQDTTNVRPALMDKDEQMNIHKAVARAMYVTGTPFSQFEHPLWKEAFHMMNPLYGMPSRKRLATSLLDEEYSDVQSEIVSKINQASIIHLAIDGWSNLRKESILNVILYAPKPYFYKFIETKEQRHTAEYLCEEVTNIIEEFHPSKFVAVVTDNAANMVRFGKLLHDKYEQTLWTGCLAHTLHLFVGDSLKVMKIRRIFAFTVRVIKTITRSHILGAEFRRLAEEKSVNSSLQLPVKTRWGSYLACLQSFIKSKIVVQNMVINESTTSLRQYKNKILNEDTWTELRNLERFLDPIVQWIYILEGDYFAVHLVYKAFKELDALLNNYQTTNLLENNLADLKAKFEERKANALKPIHFAATILDPKNQGSQLTDQENVDGCEIIFNLGNESTDILMELSDYKTHKSIWAKDFVWKMAATTEPVTWWETLFSNTVLGKTAVKILTMPATSAAVERSFSTFSNIHTKRRNRLKTNRAGKLTYISHNWKLSHQSESQKPFDRSTIVNEDMHDTDSSNSEDEFSDVEDMEDGTSDSISSNSIFSTDCTD